MWCVCGLELGELLALDVTGLLGNLEDVEADSLGEGTALADNHAVALVDPEAGGHVDGEVRVTLLETVVLGDVVEVVTPDDARPPHLCRHNNAVKNPPADRDRPSEGALLVNVRPVDRLIGGGKPEPDVLHIPLSGLGKLAVNLLPKGDVWLLLECTLGLFFVCGISSQLGSQ